MAEGDAVRAHHPVDHRPAGIAPEAVPEIGLRRHDAARGLIPLVPGTSTSQVLALTHEPVSLALDETHEGDLALQALELGIRDPPHARQSPATRRARRLGRSGSIASITSSPGLTCTRTAVPIAKPARSSHRPARRTNGIRGSTGRGEGAFERESTGR